jgi:hypothetical protein
VLLMAEMVHDLLQISSGLPGACDHSIPYDATPGPLSGTFGENACHPERSEGSLRPASQILRCAQDDRQNASSPLNGKPYLQNVWVCDRIAAYIDMF